MWNFQVLISWNGCSGNEYWDTKRPRILFLSLFFVHLVILLFTLLLFSLLFICSFIRVALVISRFRIFYTWYSIMRGDSDTVICFRRDCYSLTTGDNLTLMLNDSSLFKFRMAYLRLCEKHKRQFTLAFSIHLIVTKVQQVLYSG